MNTKSDLELIVLAKSSNVEVASQAQLTLWNRYQFFIQKKYYQWISTFSKEHLEFDDFMQEAYIAMIHAIELCDVDRLKAKNVKNFSTVLYFQLIKIKNRYDVHYEKYGNVVVYSQMIDDNCETPEDRFSGFNSISGQWITATSIESESEIKKYMYEKLVNDYKHSLDDIDKKICQLLIERNKVPKIAKILSSECDEVTVKKRVLKIKSGLKNFVEENAYI